MQSVTRVTPLAFCKSRPTRVKVTELCLVIELPVRRVIFVLKLANNGEVLAGALFQGESDESKMIPWEVVLQINFLGLTP